MTPKFFNCSGAQIQCRGYSFLPAQPPELRMAVLWDLFKMAPETASNCLQMHVIYDVEVPLILSNHHHVVHRGINPLPKVRETDTWKSILQLE